MTAKSLTNNKQEVSGSRAAWLSEAGYGLALHWTTQSLPRRGKRPIQFRKAVERFDVTRLAEQCLEAGAGWLLFTISHAQEHLPFPCETLDRVLPGRTCERDLMGELSAALAPHKIPLIFYNPSIADDSDPEWQRASGWLYDPASFASLQYDIVAEIGEKYGNRLAGWWIDNCYDPSIMPHRWHHLHHDVKGYANLYDLKQYASALRKGNTKRIVAFNFSGTAGWRSVLGKGIVDYEAGEANSLCRVPTGPLSGEGGSQWHCFVYMDDFWVHNVPGEVAPPRYDDEHVISYIKYLRRHGGAFSYGAAPYQDEGIAEATMAQLRGIRKGTH